MLMDVNVTLIGFMDGSLSWQVKRRKQLIPEAQNAMLVGKILKNMHYGGRGLQIHEVTLR